MLVYGKYECFIMQMYVCASCGSSQCCILHDLQFVNDGPCILCVALLMVLCVACL